MNSVYLVIIGFIIGLAAFNLLKLLNRKRI